MKKADDKKIMEINKEIQLHIKIGYVVAGIMIAGFVILMNI